MLLSIAILFPLVVLAIILVAPIAVVCAGAAGPGRGRVEVRCSWLHPGVLKAVIDNKGKTLEVLAFGALRLYAYGAKAFPPQKRRKAAKAGSGDHAVKQETFQEKTAGPERVQPLAEQEKGPAGPQTAAAQEQEPGRNPWRSRFLQGQRLWVYLGNGAFRGKIIRWLGRTLRLLLRICSVGHVRLLVRMGFDDPAATGTAYGWYTAFRSMLPDGRRPRCSIVYKPAFSGEPFEAEGEAVIKTSIARLCLPVAAALATFPYLSAFLVYRTARKIDKQ
jgi:hypothetical protein